MEPSTKETRILRILIIGFFALILISNAVFLIISVLVPVLSGSQFTIHESADKYNVISFYSAIALLIVLSLHYVAGEIKFDVIGFKFEGASGPVVLWIMCFL